MLPLEMESKILNIFYVVFISIFLNKRKKKFPKKILSDFQEKISITNY